MKRALNTIFCSGMLALLVACGSKLTSDNFYLIKNGMTEEEVKALIGKPKSVKNDEMLGLSSTVYTYQKGESEAKVGFINGKVTHKSGKFEQ
ncbi:MAG: hypothetical protein AAF571_10165 [Verrucomicrobiota bacterium]